MSKSTVTTIFIGGVIAVVAGAILGFAAVWVAYSNDAFVMSGPDVVGVRWSGFTWTAIGLAIVASLAIMGGLIAGLVSWIGALLNTAQLEDKAWFIVLLLLGIWNLGLLAMIAYVVAGPDAKRAALPTAPTQSTAGASGPA